MNAETCDRADLISRLFRETDRAQRMKTPLSLIAFCIVELDDIHRQYGVEASDDAIRQVSGRTLRLLRSYDLLGHTAFNELILALPGCGILNATILADRLRVKVFAASFQVARQQAFLSPCFGVAPAYGRSPIVVLREASSALQFARAMGPGTIYCLNEQLQAATKLPVPLDQRPVAGCSCSEPSTNS